MSAMTGPRSPTSPWPPESPNLQLAGHTNPSALFPLCDPHPAPLNPSIGSHSTAPDRSGPSYFSISVENSSNPRKGNDTYAQSSIPSPKPQLLSKKAALENHVDISKFGSGLDERRDPTIYRLSLNRGLKKREATPDRSNVSLEPTSGNYHAVSAERCAELLGSPQHDIMLLDVRPFAHFAKRNIKGSLNLCIPTTLLKRPSFDTNKLANTFTDETDKMNFSRWRQCRYIAVYDAATSEMKDMTPLANVLKKFAAEGWNGEGLILLGGFNAFLGRFPALTQQQESSVPKASSKKPSPMHISLPSAAPIAGGCALPDTSQPTIPFFGNIRQNMDLVGGVGQIPLQLPETFTEVRRRSLPPWLRKASDPADKGLNVSEKFLDLEKKELERMKQALSYDKSADSTSIDTSGKFRVAGIEKGTKNRYNDIYPFDHSRVRLQDVPPGGCDYVNANYMKAERSGKCYIATQAPVPDTFNDFWRVVWEQDVRLIVSLTAEVERGQVKCHPYWESGTYGHFRVNQFSQRYIYMNSPGLQQVDHGPDKSHLGTNEDSGNPCIIVRHFGLSHSSFPFQQLREITQLQYPYWPDFGTTSQPAHLLKLIDQCDKVISATSNAQSGGHGLGSSEQRPVVVHCSAGCGRTGTFCTVDSVLDILKQQHSKTTTRPQGLRNDWTNGGDLDLIAEAVAEFRTQRPSMVQNLSQFVLCYESVLEWAVSQMADEVGSNR